MMKIIKISILLAVSVLLISSCEKQPGKKKQVIPKVIVSKSILAPQKVKTEKLLAINDEKGVSAQKAQTETKAVAESKTLREKVPTSSKPVTEELAKKEQADADSIPGKSQVLEKNTSYDPKGRVDPFLSLIQEKEEPLAASPKTDEKEEPKRILTPLEKLEVSQIRLVAVILMKNRQLAMVEEATGKGYEIKIGTYIGKNGGQVSKINQSSIIIRESVKDYKGKRKERFQEIKLHKKESVD
jgi:type IV pilus assembly protein PilP